MSEYARGFRECLAALLDDRLGAPPEPAPGEATPQLWQQWLAEHHLGLVPVADPGAFHWAGSWIAVVLGRDGELHAVLMFGVPSGPILDPDGVLADSAELAIEAGFVVAPLGAALLREPHASEPSLAGTVEAILVAAEAESPLVRVTSARALAGRGLEGDRYATRQGTFGRAGGSGYDLTLIEAEALGELEADGVAVSWEDARRNVVTRGVDLNALVGRRFRVGEVECVGRRLAEPCAHLQRLTRPGVLRGLVHRGGLRADILSDGAIAVGDRIC